MVEQLDPGEQILLDGQPAEVIKVEHVGEMPFLRVYIEGEGVKSVGAEDVDVERHPENGESEEALGPGALSAERFDLRTQAMRFRLAHQRGQLLSISNSLVRLEPYQLACVNQVMQKLRQRALIADDVGLGKTIEAGLILKELDARRRADRVLFVVPAHLQKKWIREMDRFFDISLTKADRAWVEGEKRRLGEEANVWNQDEQRLITSQAFLRQEKFEAPLEETFWDVAVVDEAHKGSKKGDTPSKTAKRIEQVSGRSDALLLLSATPHTGKEQSFRSLVSYIDPLRVAENQELTRDIVDEVMIRRGKETIFDDEGERIFPNRDVQTVPVGMSLPEEDFYEAVTEYVRRIYNRSSMLNKPVVGFAMALMQKRLVSSIGAIKATLERRLEGLLEEDMVELTQEARSYLEGEDLEEDDQIAAQKELERVTVAADAALHEELEALRHLLDMAEEIPVDSKAQKVRRFIESLLEEDPNEKVLLFTEYRDTLDYFLGLCEEEPWYDEIMVIHGDVDKDDRTQIEDEFNYGEQRLLFATDAASEGIDLQKSCHVMINYELPWNPNRLEQRIGRIHRYGQEREVKVWNFQFDGTREAEIFEMLQNKVENIRSRVGATADVLGMIEDLGVEDLIMRSIRDEEPPSATQEELERELEQREQTLLDWYERSLIDCSTFDAESRRKIQEVVDDSEDVFGSAGDVQRFVIAGLRAMGGRVEQVSQHIFRVGAPEALGAALEHSFDDEQVTFDRDVAMQFENKVTYLSPDHELVTALVEHIFEEDEDFGGRRGVKVLPFLDQPGIVFNYRIAFEDGAGEILREELCPVYVDSPTQQAERTLGQRVLDGKALDTRPDRSALQSLRDQRDVLKESAETYLSQTVQRIRSDLSEDRQRRTERELQRLDEYAAAERSRLQSFIEEYQEQQEAGADMEIAIRGQEKRLQNLEARIQERKANVRDKGRVVSLAPELVNWCYAFSA
ncbi:superfamily II DNA or RNA helicase [Salinibacter ruber]|uniref:DEAD/DEAH box helicase n=1 Tax=Salinibacter ruber TaxID=146919 RepID=UPI0021675A5A|nr:DEAD/DEAH box helicase [Salinibacter ruber]MCS3658142.1 superfamily II DNA or RNA helicase [Salinibacter ruber]MCS3824045.1 superfamily II DNA or RNA helicase [Salinibacter ruber]